MSTAIFAVIAGAAFIFLGRWIYTDPKTLYASSLEANHDAALHRVGTKLVAIVLIFGGAYAAVAAPAELLIPQGWVVTSLGLVAGVLASLFLRPRVTGAVGTGSEASAAARIKQGWLLTGKGKLFLVTMIGGALVVGVETLVLPLVGRAGLLPDVGLVTILIMATAMLLEMLFVK